MSTWGGPPPEGGAGERWSPYPVQDWSTLPATGPPHQDGSDSGPTPIRQQSDWLPLFVVSLVTVLVASALFVADQGEVVGGRTAAAAYLPKDGAVSYRTVTNTTGNRSVIRKVVEESARSSGRLVTSGLDYTLGAQVGGVVGFRNLDRVEFWRITGTDVGGIGEPQRVRVYRVDEAVTLIADSAASGAAVYSPGLVELPADVAAGASWSSEGNVGDRRYRSELRAEAAEAGCLRVSGTLVESPKSGQPTTRQVSKLWCRGRGMLTEELVNGQSRITSDEVSTDLTSTAVQTIDEDWIWSDPTNWRRRDFRLTSADPTLGSGMMTGSPGLLPSVVTASGLLIRPTNAEDLVAATPRTIDTWTTLWRMHPGGTVLSLAAFGNVVVATTSRREVVGYTDTGLRLWTVALDDVVFRPAVRVDERRIAIGDAGGGVRVVDLRTGEQIWHAKVTDQLSAPLIASARAVIALDQGGTTTAFAPDTGDRLWSTEVSGTRGAIFGDLVVVRHEGTLDALDLSTGRHRWLLPQTGTLDSLQPFGDVLLAASRLDTLVIDEHGVVRQRLPPYGAVTVVGQTMVGWDVSGAEFRDHTLALRLTVDFPEWPRASLAYRAVPYRHGVIIFGDAWSLTTWSSEP
ncbi:MAG: PQQ-binding-like beta-propeller repeat protein [Microlunatus sp.]